MNGAIVIRWGASVAGREAKGVEGFGNAGQRFEEFFKTGRIHSPQKDFFVTGTDGGFMIAQGELAELLAIAAEDETLKLNAQASAIVHDFEVQVYGGGTDEAVQSMVGLYAGSLQEIGYM